MARKKQPKMTPTTRHFHTKVPDEVVYLPAPMPGEIPPDRTPIPRLAIHPGEFVEYSPELLASNIENSPPNSQFFCDSNLFIRPTHEVVWKALCKRQVNLIPNQIKELASWFTASNHNQIAHQEYKKMMDKLPSQFNVFYYDYNDPINRGFMDYYVNLLGMRKRIVGIVTQQLTSKLQREPTPVEIESALKKSFGERGFQLGKRGLESVGSENFFTDESLVVTAMTAAIITGQETFILTTDPDLQEQAYKFFGLLNTHYRSLLFAKEYHLHPECYETQPLPKDDSRTKQAFVGQDDILIQGQSDLLEKLLPEIFHPVCVYSWLLNGPDEKLKFCPETYCLEREMQGLLKVKGESRGRNTTRFNGKNCHTLLSPLPLPDGHAVIAEERTFPFGSSTISLLDLHHALSTNERFRHGKMVTN